MNKIEEDNQKEIKTAILGNRKPSKGAALAVLGLLAAQDSVKRDDTYIVSSPNTDFPDFKEYNPLKRGERKYNLSKKQRKSSSAAKRAKKARKRNR